MMKNKIIASSISVSLTFSPLVATAAPSGGQVTSGHASIQQTGQITNINQSSQNASIDWNSFNIGSGETVNFIQPNSNAITINNIHDANPSTIMGNLNANGRVFLSNPNGVIFTSGSQVNVGSLLATSSNIELQDEGSLLFSNPAAGSIINQGEIISADSGFIAFFAPDIKNEGSLQANNGDVVLSTANSGTLFLPDSAGIGFNLESLDSIDPLGIDNGGEIKAAGGRVLLSSDAIDSTLRNAINNDGLISVSAIQNDGGQIRLLSSQGSIDQTGTLSASAIEHGDGGDVIIIAEKNLNAAGSIDARGGHQSGDGGFVETSGLEHIRINTFVDTRAENGETGSWLIDPTDLTINDGGTSNGTVPPPDGTIDDSSLLDVDDLISALNSSNIILQADNSITVNETITGASSGNSLTFESGTVNVNAAINLDGSVIFDSSIVNLSASVTSGGKISFAENTNINVNGTQAFTINGDSEFDMRGAVITGSSNGKLTLASGNGNIFLLDLDIQDSLDHFTIQRTGAGGSFNFSGEINAKNFTFTTDSNQIITLASDLTINASNDVVFGDSVVTGGSTHNMSITAANITLDEASSLASLTLTSNAAATTTLTGDLAVDGGNLTISGGTIVLGNDINVEGLSTSSVLLQSQINDGVDNFSLTINVFDGQLQLDQVSDINNLTITNGAPQTVFNGEINIDGIFSITGTNSVSFSAASNSITASSILTSATLLETDGSLALIATGEIHSGSIDATSGVNIDGADLYLYDDITADEIDLSANTAIFIAGDTVLTGTLNIGTTGNTVDINSVTGKSHDLSIVLGTQDFILGDVGNINPLSSFSLTGTGNLTLEGSEAIPQTNGTGGVSFLGNLNLSFLTPFAIDTSANNGAINLSGLMMDTAAITLTAGSGDISLGTFGSGEAISSIAATTTGTINLHGNIYNTAGSFDFSSASAIVLHDDITFGSEETALTSLKFGTATLDGNYDLTVYSAEFSVGEVGQDIALQNMTLNLGENDFTVSSDLNIAGNLIIEANTINLDALVSTSGGDITLASLAGIQMTSTSEMTATDGSINASADAGDIALSRTTALNQANITATAGNITNSAGDYQSSDSTSINISASDINLISGLNTGQSESSPLVLDAGNSGSIDINAGSSIFIANLSNSDITTNQDFVDNSAQASLATNDALYQIKQPQIEGIAFQHLDVVDPQWQQNAEEEDGSVRADQTISAPRIYYSKKGWRLGNPK